LEFALLLKWAYRSFGEHEVWTPLFCLVLALLPKPWRETFHLSQSVWRFAGAISGFGEAAGASVALVAWYSYSVTHWVARAVLSTMNAHPESSIPENTVGFAALVLVLMHPVTWVILYFGVEGVVRGLASALTGGVFGILPLYLLERGVRLLTPQRGDLGDAFSTSSDLEGEILEIQSARSKPGWELPRIVRFRGNYYRLLNTYRRTSSRRPFVFVLRRLPVGVPGPTVIEYAPPDAVEK